MALDLSSLRKAVNSLERALNVSLKKQADANADDDDRETIRAGVIQNFEFTYELCWKFMKRWIEENISHEAADGVTRKQLFRMAAENRLLERVEKWFEFHQARNKTSHVYDEEIAEQVYAATKEFLPQAKLFLERIEARND